MAIKNRPSSLKFKGPSSKLQAPSSKPNGPILGGLSHILCHDFLSTIFDGATSYHSNCFGGSYTFIGSYHFDRLLFLLLLW